MRKTLLVLGTAAILFVALFRVEFVAQEPPREPTTVSPVVAADSGDTAPGSRPAPNPVQEGTFTPLPPVQDRQLVNVRGRVLTPSGEVADGINWFFVGFPAGWSVGTGGGQEVSGEFNADVPSNSSYVVAVFDKRNRYAAPLQRITVGSESPEGELVFQFEEGVPLTAAFIDQETGEPIPGLRISLMQRADVPRGDAQVMFQKTSDENGLFQAHVMPGEYVVSVDHLFINPEAIRQGVHARRVVVEADKPVSLEFRIPRPFVGKVLNVDGTPARDRIVFVLPNVMGGAQVSTFTSTDQEGIFRRIQQPIGVAVNVRAKDGEGQYFAWFGNELADVREHTFQLVEGTEVTGRLLDANTNEPLGGQLFFSWKKNPNDPVQRDFMPDMHTTDASGHFRIQLNPAILYDLFVVHGRQSRHGGGPYEPRIDMATLGPEQLKGNETVALGDILIDSGRAFVSPDAWVKTLFTEIAEKVRSGEKKSMLQIYVKEGAEDALDYILKHQNEEPLASFALFIVPFEKLSEAKRREFDAFPAGAGEAFIIANDPILASAPEGILTLSQLRGEKDSQWNVSEGDPSRAGDWKQSPGMFNPAILDNFLKDILERTAQ